MKVATYYNNHDVRIEERSTPKIGADEVLIQVAASGICGSDVLEWYRVQKAPLVLGHEVAGEITQAGSNVERFKVGERVFVSHHIPCNTCKYCLSGHHTACHTLHTTNIDPGGFAEFVRVPALNVDRGLFPLPKEVSYEEATLIEPLGCVVRGQRAVGTQPGDTIAIIGSGVSGLLHASLAKTLGAGKIICTDIDSYRLEAAKNFGADHVVKADADVPEFIRSVNGGILADRVIVCAGSLPALEQALQSVDKGGIIEFFATCEPGTDLALPMSDFWKNDLTLVTSYGAAPVDLSLAIRLIQTGRIDVAKMITHRFPLAEAREGFKLVAKAGNSLKVIIQPISAAA